MMYAYDFLTYSALAKGHQYLNNLFWAIYGRLTTFTQNGRVLIVLGREWRDPHPGGVPLGQRVRCRPCAATVSEGERQQI
jgi:hypothetical protein